MKTVTPHYFLQQPPLCEACKRDRDTLAHPSVLDGIFCWKTKLYYEQNEDGVLKFSAKLKPSRSLDNIRAQIQEQKASPSSPLS